MGTDLGKSMGTEPTPADATVAALAGALDNLTPEQRAALARALIGGGRDEQRSNHEAETVRRP